MRALFFITMILVLSSSLMGQESNSSDGTSTPQETTVVTPSEIEGLSKKIENLSRELSELEEEIKNNYSTLEKELKTTKADISAQTNIDLETTKDKITQRRHRLIQTAVFTKSINKSIVAIDASVSQAEYMKLIIKLNNPSNEDLGFSLNTIISELVKTHITDKDKKLGKAGKVNDFVNSLINHPVTDIAKSAVPAINTVVSFISNLSFGSKKIKQEDFESFTKELKKYLEYYEGLAKATLEYESNLQQIQIRAAALNIYLKEFAIERMATFHQEDFIPRDIDEMKFSALLRKYYSNVFLEKNIPNTRKILGEAKYNYPITTLNQARYLQDELESLSNQYIRVNTTYYESISKTLTMAKQLDKSDPGKIDKKIKDLKEDLVYFIEKYQDLIDIDDVKNEFSRLIQ